MKAKGYTSIMIIFAFLLTVNTNVYAKKNITKSGIEITVKENLSMATNYFTVLDFVFDNTTQDWIRIKQVKAFFNDENKDKNISFTSGRDLAIWVQATQKMKEIEAQKAKIFLGIIGVLGAGIAGFSSGTNIKTLGTMTTVGAISSLSIMEFNKRYNEVEKAKIFPENHIFASEFIIPPGIYIKRFLVLNSRNHKETGFVRKIFLEILVEDQKAELIELSFRRSKPKYKKDTFSKWQSDLIVEEKVTY
jgi:hypothetical protein